MHTAGLLHNNRCIWLLGCCNLDSLSTHQHQGRCESTPPGNANKAPGLVCATHDCVFIVVVIPRPIVSIVSIYVAPHKLLLPLLQLLRLLMGLKSLLLGIVCQLLL